MDQLIYLGFGSILMIAVGFHLLGHRRREAAATEAAQKAGLHPDGPVGRHPHIDTDWCIGCGACVTACPEGDVLAVIGGKAALINGHKCIGHELCAEACPVGAIQIVMAPPSMTADLPALTEELETSVPNVFVAGELGGLALIKNAVNQGRECVDRLAERMPELRRGPETGEPTVDLAIVGAGPAGLSATLRAHELGLSFVTLESEDLGGTVAKYPRQKLVMTSPVEFPGHGKFKKLEISKEELLGFWTSTIGKAGLSIRTRERVERIERDASGRFLIGTGQGSYRARGVILAIGRRGTPRKLGVPGEELPHVMYSLLDAEAYTGKRILVVGGGDSAVEAAMGLAHQSGNRVAVSYRRSEFSRLKHRNTTRIAEAIARGQVDVIFSSSPVEIREGTTVLEVAGERREVPADFVWIFAGGTPPKAFLESVGIRFGRHDQAEDAKVEAAEQGRAVAAA
ncbi:MAG: NAD(P)-binding domain-containing protein [Gemmatimonadales bacterium]